MAESIQGRYLWYQLNTTDSEKGVAFYRDLIGWGLQVHAPEGAPPYPMFTNNGIPLGGAYELVGPEAAGAPPHWLPYIGSEDVDADHAKVVAAGGKSYVAPADIPDVGRFAVVADPWGAIFALYKPGSTPPPQAESPLHGFSWNEVSADDLEASWKFYQDLFGWEVMEEHDMGPEMGPYRIYGRLGFRLGGMYKRPPQMPVNAFNVYIRVEDVDQDKERVEKAGGKTTMPPMEVPGGDKIAGFQDPQGAIFWLHAKAKG